MGGATEGGEALVGSRARAPGGGAARGRGAAAGAPSRGVLLHPVRGWLYVGLQELRGHPLGRFVRTLRRWERLERAEFDARRERRLRDMLAFARARVSLYRTEPWARASPDGGELRGWPLLERETVHAHADELRALRRSRGPVVRRTSGSTGRPVRIPFTAEADTWNWAHRYRGLMWHGIPIGARALRLTQARHALRDRVLGQEHVPALDGPEAVERAVRFLRDARPRLVIGSPSDLFYLARCLRERGVREPLAPFARSGGEQLHSFQRAEIEAVLAGRVVDSYGCTEIGALAGECPAGSLHVYAEHVHLEVFREGEPAAAGEPGDLVATTLVNRALPLVRYRIGDRGRISPEPCRCGLPHPVLLDLQARTDDELPGLDGRRHASELVEGLGTFFAEPLCEGVRLFQLERLGPARWRVWVEGPGPDAEVAAFPPSGGVIAQKPRSPARAAAEDRLAAIARRTLGEGCRVEVEWIDRIPREPGKYLFYRL